MLKVNDIEFKKETNILTLTLKRNQLDYSPKVIEYVQVKKKADVENLYYVLNKRKNPQEYRLSVYLCDGKTNLYHVYGQESGSFGNAFILGALLLDKSFSISDDKYTITGIIHTTISDQRKLEISNLNELFRGYCFKIDTNTGNILPVYSLEGRLLTNKHKNKPVIKQIKRKLSTCQLKDNVYPHLIAQRAYPAPQLGCPEGYNNCISNCNYHIQDAKNNNRCGFECKLGNDLRDCNDSCAGYLKLSNNRHCCRYEFSSSCEYKKEK